MAESLFPDSLEELDFSAEEIAENEESTTIYKGSVYFDFETGDFLMDGQRKIVESSAYDAWMQWCQKMMQTPRYKCEAYSTDAGIDTTEVIGMTDREAIESILTYEITEALEADPYGRVAYVESVKFDWNNSDSVYVTVSVIGVYGDEFTTTTALTI